MRTLVALNGSPVRQSSVDRMLAEVCAGAVDAGGRALPIRCDELAFKPCQACGPEPTTGYCIFHDDMDRVYEALRDAHAVVIGSPVYFDGVSGPLKLVMDRCNCLTMLMRDGSFRPQWPRTRRGAFVTACSTHHPHELAERSVRGYLKWIGARWEETLAYRHEDNDLGSVASHSELLERARSLGRRLIESDPHAG